MDGTPARCYESGCDGAWRSLRSRHCKDCGLCQFVCTSPPLLVFLRPDRNRVEFDHHCAFLGACIAKQTIKSFAIFLIAVVPLISVSLIPIGPLVWQGLRSVVRATWDSEELYEKWWSRKVSWVGGPFYRFVHRGPYPTELTSSLCRYVGGLIYGYILYPNLPQTPPPILSSPLAPSSLATPHLAPLIIVLSAILILPLALAMIYVVLSNAANGVITIEVERRRRWRERAKDGWDPRLKLWVPATEGREGRVVLVDAEVRLHDFGMRENWRRFVGESWREWIGWTGSTSYVVASHVGSNNIDQNSSTELRQKSRQAQ